MKRIPLVLISLLLCALLAGCGSKPAEVAAAPVDALTGGEARWQGERPIAVTVTNARNAAAQRGISAASVVMEAYAAGDHTDLCLVFPSIDAVPQVGPVAQGNDLYWHFLRGLNVLPVQRGGSAYALNYLHYTETPFVDALEVGTNAFSCEGGYEVPNDSCWFTSGSALAAVLPGMGIGTRLAPAPLADFGEPNPGTIGAAIVQVTYTAGHTTLFGYDGSTHTYFMSRPDSASMKDANNGAQTAFDNLLLLCPAAAARKDDGRTWDYEGAEGTGLQGGSGWLITAGTCRPLTWQRAERDGTLLHLQSTDEEPITLALQPGRTYIGLLCPDSIPEQSLVLQDAGRNVTLNIS